MSATRQVMLRSALLPPRSPWRRSRSATVGAVLMTAAFSASVSGCGDESTHTSTEPACPGPSQPIDPTALIDDFEDGNSTIALVAGRTGGWYSYGDPTAGAQIQPLGDAPPEAITGGRGTSQRALHLTSTGFLDWGSGVSAAFHWGPNAAGVNAELPYDGHSYLGVTFFARIGDTSSPNVRIQFDDQRARPEAGICVVDGPIGQNCYDGFGTDIPALTTSWQEYRIAFADLRQRQFGIPGDALDTTQLYEMEFLFPPGVVMDFWVDDLRFYR